MDEGYWINYRTQQVCEMCEHETWIRVEDNARLLGVPRRIIARFHEFKPVEDRDTFLLFLLKKVPLIRVRVHGDSVTFEFWARFKAGPLHAVRLWVEKKAGPLTMLNIVNFAKATHAHVLYEDFHRWLCPNQKSLADLSPEERWRAKALLLGGGAGAAMRPGPDGKIVIRTE